ncbi:MAG TPA: DNA polymerase III subunit alpha, partial [Candidatus Eisenbacteria bacterium]|nr:DNA polymerase III subunit alpha [Candidatus Eisenbacteria bacterium]
AEFIAAVISNQGGYYDTFAYVSEARRMGLTVLPPDVNESERVYTGKGCDVRVGLMQLKGLRAQALEALVAERTRGGPFASWEDLRRRVRLHVSDAELLVKSGACDSIASGRTRPQLLWELYLDEGRAGPSGALDLFTPPSVEPPPAPAYDRETVLRHETETLGFLLSVHPIEPYERAMRGRGVIPARDLDRHVGRRVRVLGWYVTSKLIETAKHEPMEFRGFEDTTALFDATLFPEAYRKFCHLLTSDRPFLLTGKVEEEFGVCSLVVEHVERL